MNEDRGERLLRDYYATLIRRAAARQASPRTALGQEPPQTWPSRRQRAPMGGRFPSERPWLSALVTAAALAIVAGSASLYRYRATYPELPGLVALIEARASARDRGRGAVDLIWEALTDPAKQ